jgi:hypothetical protein
MGMSKFDIAEPQRACGDGRLAAAMVPVAVRASGERAEVACIKGFYEGTIGLRQTAAA